VHPSAPSQVKNADFGAPVAIATGALVAWAKSKAYGEKSTQVHPGACSRVQFGGIPLRGDTPTSTAPASKSVATGGAPQTPEISTPSAAALAIVRRHAEAGAVSVEAVLGQSRYAAVARARHAAMLELRQRFGWSYEHIGRFFGGRNHAAAIYGCRRAAGWTAKACQGQRAAQS